MQAKVEQVTDLKQGQYSPSCKIHCGKDGAFFVNEDATALVGKSIELGEITTKKSKNPPYREYKTAKIINVIEPPSTNGAGPSGEPVIDGRPTLAQFLDAIHTLHAAVLLLEPDIPATENDVARDRAEQRAKILISAMIAVSDGRINLGGDGEESPF